MEKYIPLILGIPIVWFLVSIIYHIGSLFYLWIKYKLEDIKTKEFQLWD